MANTKTILGMAAISLLLTTREVRALPPASSELAALLLARTCIKEAGWEITDDCAAIHTVVQNRANMEPHTYYEEMLGRYSKVKPGKPWIQQLDIGANKPKNWPRKLRWVGVHDVKWRAMLRHAQKIVSGKIVATCDPAHWGDRKGDHTRAVTAGWKEVTCGDTKNEFWVVSYRKAGAASASLKPCKKPRRKQLRQVDHQPEPS